MLSIIGICVIILIMMALVISENAVIAVILAVFTIIGVDYWILPFLTTVWSFILLNPMLIATYVILYIITGVVYSIIKWIILLRSKTINEYYKPGDFTRNNKTTICSWIGYWLLWLGWDILQWPLTKMWKHIYNLLADTYIAIERRALNK